MNSMTWNKRKEELARRIVEMLYSNRMIRTFYRDKPEGWNLISGLYSPVYIQLRPLISFPNVFRTVCEAMAEMVKEEAPGTTKIIGIAMAGVPLCAGMAVCGDISAGFTRKIEGVKSVEALRSTIQSYGEHSLLEGELKDSENIVLVDDLVTKFDSKLVALEQIRMETSNRNLHDVKCDTIAVVLDREQGGKQAAAVIGKKLISLVDFRTLGLPLLRDAMNSYEWEVISDYLEQPDKYQNIEVQKQLSKRAAK